MRKVLHLGVAQIRAVKHHRQRVAQVGHGGEYIYLFVRALLHGEFKREKDSLKCAVYSVTRPSTQVTLAPPTQMSAPMRLICTRPARVKADPWATR